MVAGTAAEAGGTNWLQRVDTAHKAPASSCLSLCINDVFDVDVYGVHGYAYHFINSFHNCHLNRATGFAQIDVRVHVEVDVKGEAVFLVTKYDAIVAWGDTSGVRARIDAMHAAGADHVAIIPLAADGSAEHLPTLEALAPRA